MGSSGFENSQRQSFRCPTIAAAMAKRSSSFNAFRKPGMVTFLRPKAMSNASCSSFSPPQSNFYRRFGPKPPNQSFSFLMRLKKEKNMRKLIIAAFAIASVVGSALSAKATPLLPAAPSADQSQIEQIGCSRSSSNDTCPYGYQPRGYGCVPCWKEKHGSRYRDWDERYNEPRRYRDYGYSGPRRYHDDEGYEPRRYPRGYY